jgi:hypothetical protein
VTKLKYAYSLACLKKVIPGQAPTKPFERQGLNPSEPTGYAENYTYFKHRNLNHPSLS